MSDTCTVVIAPDSFKGSLAATEVAEALAAGWLSVRPGDSVSLRPQADGGEGTLTAIQAAVPGAVHHNVGDVRGPDGRPTAGHWLELPGGIAVVELAQMCGLPLMGRPNALAATTVGLGQVIRRALQAEKKQLVIGLGGSASTDAAAGALSALGLRGVPEGMLEAGGGSLAGLRLLDRSGLLPPPPGGVILLTDVSAPLLGPTGAAAVFGPQKGASESAVVTLDHALAHFAGLLGSAPRRSDRAEASLQQPGMGAAGGAAFGFVAAWGARIEPGADYIQRLTGVDEALASADVLLTGEGRFDATSGTGKVVGELIRAASANDGLRIGVIAGQVSVTPVDVHGSPLWSASLTDLAGSVVRALADPDRWLREAGAEAARTLAPATGGPAGTASKH